MAKCSKITLGVVTGVLLPYISKAGGLADDVGGLQSVLDNIYDDMIPLCSGLIGVGRGLAGFAALWYISHRVWKHLANAEPIDFYPLFRPFVIGFAIIIFPSVIDMINGVLKPTVTGTSAMVANSNAAIETLLKQKEELLKTTQAWQMYVGDNGEGDRDRWYRYTHPDDPTGDDEGMFASVGNDIRFQMSRMEYNMKNSVKGMLSEVLQVIYQAAALCVNTMRTFQLIILAILGPLVFGLAVFDGFQHSLITWIGRYINVFLWLPIANIFGAMIGKIQENMIKLDMNQIQQAGDTFFSPNDLGYIIFMIIGIFGYCTVPSVANFIVHTHGSGGLLSKVTTMAASSAKGGVGNIAAAAQGPGALVGGYTSNDMQKNSNSIASSLGKIAGGGSSKEDKISGK